MVMQYNKKWDYSECTGIGYCPLAGKMAAVFEIFFLVINQEI